MLSLLYGSVIFIIVCFLLVCAFFILLAMPIFLFVFGLITIMEFCSNKYEKWSQN